MNASHQELLDNLLSLLLKKGQTAGSLQTSTSGNPFPAALAPLAQNTAGALEHIINLFEQSVSDNRQLAGELLDFYELHNIAFVAAAQVARCKSIPQALHTLAGVIARAVNSRYSFYLGQFTRLFSLPGEQVDCAAETVFGLSKNEDVAAARNFFARHESDLRKIAAENQSQVAMVGYHNNDHPDHRGRGNILAVPLSNIDPQLNSPGTLLFVRTDDQEPFAALDMNAANSLAEMGSAILANILYAEKLHQAYLQTITSLVRAMEAKDKYTSGHSTRVAQIACNLGQFIGLDKPQLQLLHWAGLLHDIGKIGIRDDVLNKTGKLTNEEFNHIKTHPHQSYKVLEPILALHNILDAVRHHHEHFDGSGYPDGLKGNDIPLPARILQIADVWDALTSTRSYRKAMTPDQAMDIMRREAALTMDPNLVRSFLEMMNHQTPSEKVL